ncbi:oxidoreductase [soil metagenome]
MNAKRFFITGVTSGFGRAIATAALEAGHDVVGTVRSEPAAREFESLGERAHARLLDVTAIDSIATIAAEVESRIGPIDVLVNNAGYGHEGILEESSIEAMRHQFEVNVFGAAALIKAFVPYFRERRAGRIINITSMGGFVTMPGIAWYCGSKFALEGISEVLGKEVAGFDVFVTAVAPGSFRTDWAGRSMIRAPRGIADYDAVMDPIRAARVAKSGKQLGDPAKAAQVILKLADHPAPPAHLLLGSDALALVRAKLESLQLQIDEWEDVTRSTDG